MENRKPLIAIVGRPNVGKSTLFNRLVGSRRAITSDLAGTTRDRLYADGDWQGRVLTFIDTGGMTERPDAHNEDTTLRDAVNAHVSEAIAEADAVMVVVDAASGPTAEDRAVIERIRITKKPVVLVANKADNGQLADGASEFWELGVTEPLPVSALHGRGTGDLCDRLVEIAPGGMVDEPAQRKHPVVTIIGRPNVGKSTLFNRLSDSPARITSDTPHTTRDVAVQTIKTPVGPIDILDTAGVPRRKHTGRGIAKYSLLRTIRAINQSDVAVLLIDGIEGPTVQDAHITSYVLEAGKGIVVAVNKWDAVDKAKDIQEQFFRKLEQTLGFLPNPPVIFLSAKTGAKVDRLPRAVYDVWETSAQRVETGELNRFLASEIHRLPGGKGQPKLLYATQVAVRPPSFVLFVNKPSAWAENHRRFITNLLRERYNLIGTPIRLFLRARTKEPA